MDPELSSYLLGTGDLPQEGNFTQFEDPLAEIAALREELNRFRETSMKSDIFDDTELLAGRNPVAPRRALTLEEEVTLKEYHKLKEEYERLCGSNMSALDDPDLLNTVTPDELAYGRSRLLNLDEPEAPLNTSEFGEETMSLLGLTKEATAKHQFDPSVTSSFGAETMNMLGEGRKIQAPQQAPRGAYLPSNSRATNRSTLDLYNEVFAPPPPSTPLSNRVPDPPLATNKGSSTTPGWLAASPATPARKPDHIRPLAIATLKDQYEAFSADWDQSQDKRVMEVDRKEAEGVNCSRCRLALARGNVVYSALGKVWHKECFSCSNCRTPIILPGRYLGSGGQPYCLDCKAAIASCAFCHKIIDGGCYVIPEKGNMHKDCYKPYLESKRKIAST